MIWMAQHIFFPTEFLVSMQCLYHTKDIYVKDIFESTVDGSENDFKVH